MYITYEGVGFRAFRVRAARKTLAFIIARICESGKDITSSRGQQVLNVIVMAVVMLAMTMTMMMMMMMMMMGLTLPKHP